MLERRSLLAAAISGVVYQDVTGNGYGSGDQPLGGQTVRLYKDLDNNGKLTSADGNSIATKTTASNGTFSFTGLSLRRYLVRSVPSNGVRTEPVYSDTIAINANQNKTYSGLKFATYLKNFNPSAVSNISYLINGTKTVTKLQGNVNDGDLVKVKFKVADGKKVQLSLASYHATSPNGLPLSAQTLAESQTGWFGAGWHSMTVRVPECCFQIDFVGGPVINKFGPSGSNIQYSKQSRLIAAANGGSCDCKAPTPDARIILTPSAVNEVGDDHTFTVTVEKDDKLAIGASGGDAYNGFGPAAGANVSISLAGQNGAVPSPAGPFAGSANASGQFTATFTSLTAGQVIGNATASLTVNGTPLTRDTNPSTASIPAGPGGTGPATKRFVDAKISIGPDATNIVGDPHTFTVTVLKDDGLTAAQGGDGVTGFAAATVGNVDVALANGGGAVAVLDTTASTADDNQPNGDNLNGSGQSTATFTSATAGTVTGNATVTLVVGGVTLTRDTNPATASIGAGPGGSGPAVKTFVDAPTARITIETDAVNEVGDSHTFTATVEQDDNLAIGAPGGDAYNGFGPAVGAAVTIGLTNANGAVANPTGPFVGVTNALGEFSGTFASASAGQVIGNASSTLTVNGTPITVDTDPSTVTIGAGPGGSGPATKLFVDAKISIAPDETNGITEAHTFTVTVLQDDGLTAAQGGDGVTGFTAATVGNVDVTLLNAGGAAFVVDNSNSTADDGQPNGDNLNGSGQATLTFSSATAGTVTGNAAVALTVGGVSLTRDTDPTTVLVGAGPGGSGPAVKTYVDGTLRWLKYDDEQTLLDGATFEVRRTHDRFGVDIPDDVFSVADNGILDADTDDGEFQLNDLVLGRYTIKETAAPSGFELDPDTETVELTLLNPSNADATTGDVVPVFVNVPEEEDSLFLLIIDEDGIDDDMKSIEEAADENNTTSQQLINDDNPTQTSNPAFRWNTLFAGDIVKMPTGQVEDEGYFALPTSPVGQNGAFSVADFVAGTVPQANLDKVQNVIPLRNQELFKLVGKSFVAVVYDSDVSINYGPLNANLQGSRLGLFYFTVLAVEVAGPKPSGADFPETLPESQSDRSTYDLWLRVDAVSSTPVTPYVPDFRDEKPPSISVTTATQNAAGLLTVYGEAGSSEGVAVGPADDGISWMTLSVDGSDEGGNSGVDPYLLEVPMTYNAAQSRYEYTMVHTVDLSGRRLSMQDDQGGVYNVLISGVGFGG